jgi:S-DNA-T family DNA segregation ATPase FtsK/SpoIIIE
VSTRTARKRTSARAPDGIRHGVREGLGLALIALALLGALALATHDPADVPFRFGPAANAMGPLGATLAALLLEAAGIGSVVLVLLVGILGIRVLVSAEARLPRRFWISCALLLLALATLPPLVEEVSPGLLGATVGGRLGALAAGAERAVLHTWGALLLNGLLLGVGVLGLAGIPTGTALLWVGRAAAAVGAGLWRGVATVAAVVASVAQAVHSGVLTVLRVSLRAVRQVPIWWERRARRARVAAIRDPEPEAADEPLAETAAPLSRRRRGAPDIVDHREKKLPEQEEFTFSEGKSVGPFTLPDSDLFQRPPDSGRSFDRESLIMNSRILEKKLADFGVMGRVVTVHPGPVITMYEFEPAAGIKVNRITNLSDDLALALRALSIRIIAPIPGKSVVGIEVPNPDREVVYIREMLESKSFRSSSSKLSLVLGKDIFGNPVHADLAKMPHLLVAGATGTGKSVFLNSLLCSILCRATPDEVKLLLVDPKLLELSIYEGIPHLIADVVTHPKRAAAALQGVVHKMEERYQMMAALGVRSILQFNERVDRELADGNETFRLRARPGEEEGREVAYERLPYIVVVIDELADLMVVSARDVEESLQRLAQMARASGIHLVLATQRPSVDVLTGVIKANFPSRISFQVSSRTDSRTILDAGGADHLLGQGDMLFLPPGTARLQRLHGPFVSEGEVTRLVEFLRKQGTPQFDETLVRLREESEKREERGEDTDELYDRALEIVAESRNASISYIQRRLKVGYNRAARMIEQMEEEGVIGPQEGTKGREVFVRPIGADDEIE